MVCMWEPCEMSKKATCFQTLWPTTLADSLCKHCKTEILSEQLSRIGLPHLWGQCTTGAFHDSRSKHKTKKKDKWQKQAVAAEKKTQIFIWGTKAINNSPCPLCPLKISLSSTSPCYIMGGGYSPLSHGLPYKPHFQASPACRVPALPSSSH